MNKYLVKLTITVAEHEGTISKLIHCSDRNKAFRLACEQEAEYPLKWHEDVASDCDGKISYSLLSTKELTDVEYSFLLNFI